MDALESQVASFLRRFGVSAVVDEDGGLIATAEAPPADLEPLEGYGDVVSRGDLIRVYMVEGLLRRKQPPTETLDLDRVRVLDYDADAHWMLVEPEAGLPPDRGPSSFALLGPSTRRPSWRRRLELVPAEAV